MAEQTGDDGQTNQAAGRDEDERGPVTPSVDAEESGAGYGNHGDAQQGDTAPAGQGGHSGPGETDRG